MRWCWSCGWCLDGQFGIHGLWCLRGCVSEGRGVGSALLGVRAQMDNEDGRPLCATIAGRRLPTGHVAWRCGSAWPPWCRWVCPGVCCEGRDGTSAAMQGTASDPLAWMTAKLASAYPLALLQDPIGQGHKPHCKLRPRRRLSRRRPQPAPAAAAPTMRMRAAADSISPACF